MTNSYRTFGIPLIAIFGYVLLNRLFFSWLTGTDFESAGYRDGASIIVTQALPALLSGAVSGALSRENGQAVVTGSFVVLCIVGFLCPFWRVPTVATQGAHSHVEHYFLYNPIVALSFGSLGGWIGQKLARGEIVLDDRSPIGQLGDD